MTTGRFTKVEATGQYKRVLPQGLRSFLFAPGNHPRRAEKVFLVGADVAVLDLEDAVAVAEKEAARGSVLGALRQRRDSKAYVRVNAFDTRWCYGDLDAVVIEGLDGIVVPKAESAQQLQAIATRISELEQQRGLTVGAIDLMAIIESARGVLLAEEIAAATPRLSRLAFGGADYTNDLNLEWTPEERELDFARARLAHASRLAGIEPPVDTVVVQIKDTERFRHSARTGKQFGFLGKLCIHPDQVAVCNEVFSPSAAEIAHAQSVVLAFEEAEARGVAAIQVDGAFIDYPVVYRARRVLALASR
ncbi:MAG: CoA ester lyase [Proteobacteria bacterium]|nr:CoA ester lyase [Pseudomonadota bacterium]